MNKTISDEGLALGHSSDSRQGQKKVKTTMKKLMKSATLLASVGAMLCFAGCGSGGGKPEDVVLAVLNKIQSGNADLDFLNKYCVEDTAKLFAGFGAQMTLAVKGATFTVANVFVDDDVAVVKIKQEGGENPGEEYYDARKIDGQWKVAINKESRGDHYCISQKSISECVEAFKAAVLKNESVSYKNRCSKKFLDEVNNIPPEALEEVKKSVSALKVKGHKQSALHKDSIEVEVEMPGKNGETKGNLVLKYVDGRWLCWSVR